jgi:hypothetical protein
MILAWDEGAWHPGAAPSFLWLLTVTVSLAMVFNMARGGPRSKLRYAIIAQPLPVLFALNLYILYGLSGEYVGNGEIGPGAHVDIPSALSLTLTGSLFLSFTALALALAHLQLARPVIPWVRWAYWVAFAAFVVFQLMAALLLWAMMSVV